MVNGEGGDVDLRLVGGGGGRGGCSWIPMMTVVAVMQI